MGSESVREALLPELHFSENAKNSLVIGNDHFVRSLHYSKVFNSLQQLRSDGHLCDVELLVGNETISAHKIPIITENCAFFIVEQLLDHSNALAVRKLLWTLNCRLAIYLHVVVRSILETLFSKAVTIVDAFIEENFGLISVAEGLVELTVDEIVELLSKDELQVEEEQVFKAAMRWIEHSLSRIEQTARLLSCVRLHLLEPEFFFENVCKNPIIKNSASCRNIVGGAKRNGESISDVESYDPLEKEWSFVQPMRRARCSHCLVWNGEKIYAVGGRENGNTTLREVEFYNVDRNIWIEVAPMMEKRYGCAACFLDGKLYVVGGHNGISHLTSVEVFDPQNNSWTAGIPMKQRRYGAEAVALNGYIYVMGGHNGQFPLYSVERFSPKTGVWEDMPNMLIRRSSFGACAIKNKIFVCGGWVGEAYTRDVECFDPRTKTWSPAPPMLVATGHPAVVSPKNEIYIVRGSIGSSQQCCYDYEGYLMFTDDWEPDGDYTRSIGSSQQCCYDYEGYLMFTDDWEPDGDYTRTDCSILLLHIPHVAY
ncbi:AMOP domain protein [Ancylostoma ceylanicum]|uniref:AMOP domain protein n=1 Tax=Ancylostoma ceylanicum TaxID=53326 RepID=A0A0D6M649_9BILA|nr:AMOP domain protein [Ancylostoma ceylanicum]